MTRRTSPLLWIIAASLLASLACSLIYGTPTAPPPAPTARSRPTLATPTPPEVFEPPILSDYTIPPDDMAQALYDEDVLVNDTLDWLIRTGQLGPEDAASKPQPRTYALGDQETFLVDRNENGVTTITATLRAVSEHAYIWVENNSSVTDKQAARAAERFDSEVYDVIRRVFGPESSPGLDGDPRIHFLNVYDLTEGAVAYYVTDDQYSQAVVPDSNQREILYFDLDSFDEMGDDFYTQTMAHEFQHLIQGNVDRNEFNWSDEGMAQVAERIAGFGDLVERLDFLTRVNTPVAAWKGDDTIDQSYGANYLFYLYAWERMGEDAFALMAHSPRGGMDAINEALLSLGGQLTAESFFADWTVANLVDDPSLADGRYGYLSSETGGVCPVQDVTSNPFEFGGQIDQYSATYFDAGSGGDVALDFSGSPLASLIPEAPHSGQVMWVAKRGDNSDARLTRSVDLSGVPGATLNFWVWHDLEPEYDRGYVSISTDGGSTWTPLASKSMRSSSEDDNFPNFNGTSGGQSTSRWVQEQIDLSQYAGQQIELRFEVLTDVYDTRHGMALDDISIPEIGFVDDAEQPDPAWRPEGWLRTSNVVPQHWGLYVVLSGDGNQVLPIPVGADGTARWTGNLGRSNTATIVLAAAAPSTHVPARYSLSLAGDFTPRVGTQTVSGALASDDFERPCGLFASFSDEGSSHGVEDGHLYIDVDIASWYDVAWTVETFTDAAVEVDTVLATGVPDNSWGLVCRFSDYSNFYGFEIGNDNLYTIYAFVDGKYNEIVGFEYSDAIRTGDGAQNHVRAVCSGDRLSLTVNGTLLSEVIDTRLRDGAVGMVHTAYDTGGASVHFDNFVVTSP